MDPNAWVRNADPDVAAHVAGIVFLGDPQWVRGNEYGIARRFGLAFSALELNPYIPPALADRTVVLLRPGRSDLRDRLRRCT